MYVCPNCKKEYNDEVSFCSACGSKVEPIPVLTEKAPEKEHFIVSLFAFFTDISHIITTFFAFLTIATPYIHLDTYKGVTDAFYFTDEGGAVLTLLAAFTGLGLSIAALIIAGNKKANLKTKFARITGVIIGALSLLLALVLLGNSY